ncbi:DNA repair protein RadC [Patescibacteria group bacterium]|nr:DNA repair protein RadC [Patescibacteria group bacterium]
MKELPKYPHAGHRQRLRARFLQSGLDGFLDYEIVELLLTLGTPRRDCKQMAKQVIKKFGGLRGALDATIEDLQQIKGIGPQNAFGLKLFQAISERYAKEKIPSKILLNSPKAVANYLREKIGKTKKEHFMILCLDTGNNLIKINNISIGSLNSNLVHPREVFKEAIQASAARIILAHNHPAGNLTPSKEDVKITKNLVAASKIIDIDILDHIIVSNTGFCSFKEKDLI